MAASPHRRPTRTLALGLALAALTTICVLALGDRLVGRPAALAPALGGLVLVATICVGELRAPRQTTITRTATLRPRRTRDYVTRGSVVAAGAAVGTLGVTLAVGTALGSPDDLGRAGRAFTTTCGAFTSSRGPWPGSFYSLPIGLAVLVALVAAALTCRTIGTRPSHGVDGTDDSLRLSSTRSVLLSVALVCWVTLVPVLLLMSSALLRADCASGAQRALGFVCTAGVLGAAVMTLGTLVALVGRTDAPSGQTPPPTSGDRAPVGVPL